MFAQCPATTAMYFMYFGETKRTMKKRMTAAVKTGDPKNGIAMHVQKVQHSIDWQAARVQLSHCPGVLEPEDIEGHRRKEEETAHES